MPYYDRELMERIHDVLRSGVGCNGDEIAFYRRRPKTKRSAKPRLSNGAAIEKPSLFVASVLNGCRQFGVEADHLTPGIVGCALVELFGIEFEDHPLEEVIPAIARRLLGEQ